MNSDYTSSDEILLIYNYEKYYLAYKSKHCLNCSDIIMKDKKCGILSGGSRHSCMTMEKWIHSKQKKEKEMIIRTLFTNLEQQDSGTNLQPYSFAL